jgi:hypothetical protein
MPDEPAEPNASPFEEEDDPFADVEGPGAAPTGGDVSSAGALPSGLDASFALGLARSWIKQRQTATMLGAFAAGVALGSLLRE